jgi:chromosomal replication initiation ATPase DnaA
MSYAAKERAIAFIELNPNQPNAWIECEDQLSRSYSKEVIVMTVDDVDQLDDRLQASLFRILNLVHANSNYFVYLAGSMAPNGLELREDLRVCTHPCR